MSTTIEPPLTSEEETFRAGWNLWVRWDARPDMPAAQRGWDMADYVYVQRLTPRRPELLSANHNDDRFMVRLWVKGSAYLPTT